MLHSSSRLVRFASALILTGSIAVGQMSGNYTIDAKGSCWSTFYFDGLYTRYDLESMEGEYGQITLHVRSSDLGPGEYEDVGAWRRVIVGDPV